MGVRSATVTGVRVFDDDGVSLGYLVRVDDPRLAEVEFVWFGGPYVDYGVSGRSVGCWNVWDYELDRATVEFGPLAFSSYVTNRLDDDEEVDAVVQAVVHG